jgi:hypothetical protein
LGAWGAGDHVSRGHNDGNTRTSSFAGKGRVGADTKVGRESDALTI